ncbi:MAG: metallopeptidase TldD-related protein [Nocardioidaceae bacterium]|nr:metallopeptidase TldD-related protein [Nocardioidaceae bacterium]
MTPHDLVERALEASSSSQCVVMVDVRTSANLRWANNTLTTNGETTGTSATVVAFSDRAHGTATASLSRSVVTVDDVLALVADADAAAASASPASDAAPLAADRADADWSTPPDSTSIGVYSSIAPALGEAFGQADAEGRVLYGFVDHEVVTSYLGSSTGLRLRHTQPGGHIGITGKDAAQTRSAWVGRATRDFDDVDPLALADELRTRLSWAERTVDLEAGRYDTVLPPAAVADLMIYAYWTATGREAHEGQTVFGRSGGGTRIGDRVGRPGVQLGWDPAAPGLECSPFVQAAASSSAQSVFDNGQPVEATRWIDDGTLSALIQTRESARVSGAAFTPYGDNLVMSVDGATGGLDDLVAGVERGLLLTCLWYIREVDAQTLLLTGLTRDGVYLVEGGEITGAVNNFRFNESPVDLLSRFSEAGASVPSFSREWGDEFLRTATPALRVPDFNMSSVSQAQ